MTEIRQRHSASHSALRIALIAAAMLAALLVRVPLLDVLSHDIIGHLGQWYDYIVLNGGFYALADRFADYTPVYLYLLAAAASLRETALPALSKIAAIKLPSMAFDVLMAVAMYKLVQLYNPGNGLLNKLKPALAFAITLLLPSVVINSSVWGQADSMYAACVIACVALLCAKRPGWAMVAFGAGLALKAQTVFIAPLLLFLLLRRRLSVLHLLAVPLVYGALMLPAILLGRPPLEALGSYLVQAGLYHQLSMGAPNLYLFVPPDLYHFGVGVGIVIAAISGLTIVVAFILRTHEPGTDDILACALVCAIAMPFVLPKMHERYFFIADVLSVAAALRWRRLWWLPVAYQVISLSAYAAVLQPIGWLRPLLPDVPAAALLNTLVVLVVTAGMVLARKVEKPDIAQSTAGAEYSARKSVFQLPASRHSAAWALGMGMASILAVIAVAAALAPGQRRAPAWVSSAGTFQPAYPTSITYGDALELVGYGLPQPRTDRALIMPIDLYFKPLRPLGEDFHLRVEAFATDGRSLELINDDPVSGGPLSAWLPGNVYMQQRYMTVWPTVDAPVLATYGVSWVDPQTGAALPARCGKDPCDTKVGVVPIGLDYATAAPWLRATAVASVGEAKELSLLNVAYAPNAAPGQTIPFTTTWRMQARTMGDLTLFLHLLASDGRMVAQLDAPPRNGLYPAHLWHVGEVVIDTPHLALPADLPAGDYRVVLGAYHPETLQRVPAYGRQGERLTDDVVKVGMLHVQ